MSNNTKKMAYCKGTFLWFYKYAVVRNKLLEQIDSTHFVIVHIYNSLMVTYCLAFLSNLQTSVSGSNPIKHKIKWLIVLTFDNNNQSSCRYTNELTDDQIFLTNTKLKLRHIHIGNYRNLMKIMIQENVSQKYGFSFI